jgi:PAS domain S-box-containing protein
MHQLKDVRILLVEDRDEDARLGSMMLGRSGRLQLDIVRAKSLREARNAVDGSPFDAVLLDLNLPDSSGLETLDAIRELAPSFPIVVLSGSATDEAAQSAMFAGAQDVLLKGSFNADTLERAVRYAITRHRVAAAAIAFPRYLHGSFIADTDGAIVKHGAGLEQLGANNIAGSGAAATVFDLFHDRERGHLELMLQRLQRDAAPEHAVLETAEGMKHRRMLLSVFAEGASFHGFLAPAGEHVQPPTELLRSEEKYRLLIEHSQDGVFIVIDGKIVFANAAMAEILGYETEELEGKDILDFVAPEDVRHVMNNYRRRMAGDEAPASYEFRIRDRSGARRQVLLSVGRIEVQDRIMAMGTLKDVSEQHRSAEVQHVQRSIAERAGSVADIDALADVVLSGLLKIEGVDVAAFLLRDESGLHPFAYRGYLDDITHGEQGRKLLTTLGEAWGGTQAMVMDSGALAGDPLAGLLRPLGINALIAIPVTDADRCLAVLLIASLTTASFDIHVQQSIEAIAAMLGEVMARVQAQEALRDSELLYRAVVEKSHDAILIFGGGSIRFVNQRAVELSGYDADELLTASPFSLIHADDRQRVIDIMKARFAGDAAPSMYEARILSKNGDVKIGEFAATLIRYQGEAATIVSVRDMTDRRKHEEFRRHSEALMRAAGFAATRFLRAADWETVLDEVLDHFGRSANVDRVSLYQVEATDGKAASLLRYRLWQANPEPLDTDETLRPDGKCSRWLQRLSTGAAIADKRASLPADEAEYMAELGIEIVAVLPVFAGEKWHGALRFDVMRERPSWLMSEIEAMNVCAGTLGAAIQRREADRRLLDAKDRAERGDRIRQAFIANMSHEVRTPLNVIVGYSELLRELLLESGMEEEHYSDFTQSIGDAAERLIRTVDSIMNISRFQAGDLQPEISIIRIDSLIESRLRLLDSRAREKDIDLRFINEVGELRLPGDEELLREALDHVFDNAVKFTNRGGVTVRLHVLEGAPCLEVRDTGIGIAEENLQQVFEPYIQEDMGYSRAYEGIGLGLTLAQVYLRALGGNIEVHSEKGHGSAFILHLGSVPAPADVP